MRYEENCDKTRAKETPDCSVLQILIYFYSLQSGRFPCFRDDGSYVIHLGDYGNSGRVGRYTGRCSFHNRICDLNKSEEKFCATDRYTKSPTITSFIQCKQIIKSVALSKKLTNIDRPNHVARDEETSGIQHMSMASRIHNLFNFTTIIQLFQLFMTTRLDIALYKTHTRILVLNIIL